jgi:hypothetical protein
MKHLGICLAVAGILLAVPMPLHGYVDGGTSLLLLQSSVAAISAFFVLVKSPVETVRRFVAKIRSRADA